MARKRTEPSDEKVPLTVIKVRTETAKLIAEVGEALGWTIWRVLDDLLKTELPAAHKATERQRQEVRKSKARIASVQQEARKAVQG